MNVSSIRRWHSYIGLLIAPSVLFFALTGAVQLFGLHEAHGNYRPAPLVEKLSSVHKDQVFALGDHHPPPGEAPRPGDEPAQEGGGPHKDGPPGPDDHDDEPALPAFLLKGYFLLVAIALSISTVFGLWMGLKYTPRKTLGWSLVAAGTLIPAILIII